MIQKKFATMEHLKIKIRENPDNLKYSIEYFLKELSPRESEEVTKEICDECNITTRTLYNFRRAKIGDDPSRSIRLDYAKVIMKMLNIDRQELFDLDQLPVT